MSSGDSQTEPKKRSRRFYLVLIAAVSLLAVIIGVAYSDYMSRTSYGPGPVEIEVTTDKPFYLQGEEIQFVIYVNNPNGWQVRHPSAVTHQVNKDDKFIYSDHVEKDGNDPWPAFPAYSRTLYETYQWDQKADVGDNRTLVQPGNYTFTVSFFHGIVDYGSVGSCSFEVRQSLS